MNSFGLGLVLNFVDNASAGMNTATQNFMRMSSTADSMVSSVSASATEMAAIAYSLNAVGDTFVNIGSSITGVFANVTQQVIATGMTMQGYRMQLSALYGSVEAGEAKMEEIKQYAMSSVFDIQSLIPAVTTMKAVGIEAMQEVTTSSGKSTQKLLDYASDIAAMVPNMRNAYGTGVAASMGALKEYIAEGNALSLKRGAGLDIESILGESKGSTIEERTQQVADLVEKLNIVGYTASLAGTPTQRLSNMQDALFNSLSKIADSGVFEVYCGLLEKLSNWVFSLVNNEETFNAITGILSDTISTVLSPLQSMLDWVVKNSDALINWVKEHPKLTKYILITTTAIGALLVVGGSLLKLLSSIAFAMSGLRMLKTLPSMFKLLGGSFVGIIKSALPLIALASIIYYAWKNNIFGVRDVVGNAVQKISTFMTLLSDVWSDNTLSSDNYKKAVDTGLLPIIETILDLKYRFDFFVQGFKKGWEDVSETVSKALIAITGALGGTIFEPLIEKISSFFDMLSNTDTGSWSKFGESFAKFVAGGAGVIAILSAVGKIIPVVSRIFSTTKGLFALVASNPIMAVIIAVVAGLTLLYTKSEKFRTFIQNLFSSLSGTLENVFGSVIQVAISLLISLLPIIQNLVTSVLDFLPQILPFIEQLGIFLAGIIGKVAELVMQLLPPIMTLVGSVLKVVMGLLPPIMDILDTVFVILESLFPIITELVDMVVPFITTVVDMLAGLIDGVLVIVVDLLNQIIPVITTLIDLIMPMLTDILNAVMPIVQSVMNIVTALLTHLMPVIQDITKIAAELINCVLSIVAPVLTVVAQIVQVIVGVLMPIIDVIVVALGFVIDIIVGIVRVVVAVITQIVTIVTGIINVVMGVINAIVQAVMSVVGVIVGIVRTIITTIVDTIKGIILAVQTVWDGIVAVFSGCVTYFTGIFDAVFTVISGVFQKIADFFTDVWNNIVTTFNTLGDTISGAIKGAINTVLSGAVGIINGFIGAINLAIGIINAIPGVAITKLTLLTVPQLAKGGVVDEPTTAIIGEAGAEAVVPLENNLGWIDGLASAIAPKLESSPVSDITYSGSENVVNSSDNYIDNIVNNDNHVDKENVVNNMDSYSESVVNNDFLTSTYTTIQGSNNLPNTKEEINNDYSVTFTAGSIVIQTPGTSDTDLEKVAEKIMRIIERKQQLRSMAVRK